MNDHHKTFIAFVKLGDILRDFCNNLNLKDQWHQKLNEAITLAGHKNGWFTRENVLFALKGWGELLTEEKLSEWLSQYKIASNKEKTVALIMAGNIPLVGFHDFLSVLITGNKVLVKSSSNDNVLISLIADYLINIEPNLNNCLTFTDGKLENYDAIIATGSNNTARYFEHYFSKGPNIIRKNRNSVAVLTGNESKEQLFALGEDVFRYYGLGCRSVSKLFLPKGYDFDSFFKAIFDYKNIINQAKYANNYDYNKAVYLMSEFNILDNGFLMLKKDQNYSSPIATLFYEEYDSLENIQKYLKVDSEQLQCVVGKDILKTEIEFGQTQCPELNDYADGIDTVAFLLRT